VLPWEHLEGPLPKTTLAAHCHEALFQPKARSAHDQ
jgi:hypothetical protein